MYKGWVFALFGLLFLVALWIFFSLTIVFIKWVLAFIVIVVLMYLLFQFLFY